MNTEQIQAIKPLVIRTREGIIRDVCLMNEKSYTKSIEQRRLWYLHQDTGRVLPHEGGFDLIEIKSCSAWYEAVIADVSGHSVHHEPVQQEQPVTVHPDYSVDQPPYPVSPADTLCGFILTSLEQTVRERFRTMPEGSYTTHLFSSGPEKIRKKTGEEAVELILADTPDRLIYEAADLLYHLAVLLISEGLSYEQVCAELQQRHMNS